MPTISPELQAVLLHFARMPYPAPADFLRSRGYREQAAVLDEIAGRVLEELTTTATAASFAAGAEHIANQGNDQDTK